MYDLLTEIDVFLGNKQEISKKVVRPVIWVIDQLHTQTHYATGEDHDRVKSELDTLLNNLLSGGLFKSIDTY